MTIANGQMADAADLLNEHNADGTHKSTVGSHVTHAQLASGIGTTTHADLDTLANSGWMVLATAGARISATQLTVAGDVTAFVKIGTKIKLTDTTTKYFYVLANATYSAPNTTVTILGGSDYSLVGTPSNVYISWGNPPDFPAWFAYAPTPGGFSANPTGVYRFCVNGRKVCVVIRQTAAGTSNATTLTLTAPIVAATVTNMGWVGFCAAQDNGVNLTAPGLLTLDSASSTITAYKDMSGGAWTSIGNKLIHRGLIEYEC